MTSNAPYCDQRMSRKRRHEEAETESRNVKCCTYSGWYDVRKTPHSPCGVLQTSDMDIDNVWSSSSEAEEDMPVAMEDVLDPSSITTVSTWLASSVQLPGSHADAQQKADT